MSSKPRRADFAVLGASGFYGAQTVAALMELASRYARPDGPIASPTDAAADARTRAERSEPPIFQRPVVIVIAGRNPRRIVAALPQIEARALKAIGPRSPAHRRLRLEVMAAPVDLSSPSAAEDGDSGLRALARVAPVLLNCIRPVAYEWSERVMAACAREGTAYLDLCARPAFLDAARELFPLPAAGSDGSPSSSPPPPPLVPGCGFDYALPDVATWYALRAYERRHEGRPPTGVRATFLVRSKKNSGGGFKLRLGAVDELLAPPQKRSNDGNGDDDGHRGWDPRRADVKSALERAAARRAALESQGLAVPPPRRPWLLREKTALRAGARWTAPFFVGGGVEADLLRTNLTEGVADGEQAAAGEANQALPPIDFDCRIALSLPSPLTALLLLLFGPLLLPLLLPLFALLVVGALLARRSPHGGIVRTVYLACLPYLTLGLVTADDELAQRAADRMVFERVCVLSGTGEGGGGSASDNSTSARPLRVSFRGSFAQSLTPQCIAAAAVCLFNEHVAQERRLKNAAAAAAAGAAGASASAPEQQERRSSLVLTPAQALMRPPPPGCFSFLEMLRARHGLVIEEPEL